MPSHLYVDPAAYETDVERVFYRTWQYVGHVCTLPEPGSFFTGRIANESLIIVRDERDELHAFYNVCRHRAHRVRREPRPAPLPRRESAGRPRRP